jgi:endonuclease YncB( thermonuclease family)
MPGSSVTRRTGSREVCKVWVQPLDCLRCGKMLDVGLAQISVGLAWWFRHYADEQSAEDRGRYASEEDEARLRKRGLWVDNRTSPGLRSATSCCSA